MTSPRGALGLTRLFTIPRRDWPLIGAGALLLFVAYPPFHLIVPSFLCLVPAVMLILNGTRDDHPIQRHVRQGFAFGALSGGLVHHWMLVALWRYDPASAVAYAAVVIAYGLYGMTLFGLVGWVTRYTRCSIVWIFPLLWTALEWLMAHQGFLSFPWMGLGTSLAGFPELIQIADVVGARGVTFLVALTNAALAAAWLQRHNPLRTLAITTSIAGGVILAVGYGALRIRTLDVRRVGEAVLIQSNVGFHEKWDESKQDAAVDGALSLSEDAVRAAAPDLVLLPETSLPGYLGYRPSWGRAVAEHARATHVPVLIGAMDLHEHDPGKFEFHNAALLFDAAGRHDLQPPYYKRRVVPLLERFNRIGPGREAVLLTTPTATLGTLICWEVAFEDLSRDYRKRGAHILVNLSNDAWLDGTTGHSQHVAHLAMRAVENRIGVARAANTGTTTFVDPFGRFYGTLEPRVRAYSAGTMLTSDEVPLYTRLGDWVGVASVAGAVALSALAGIRGRNGARADR